LALRLLAVAQLVKSSNAPLWANRGRSGLREGKPGRRHSQAGGVLLEFPPIVAAVECAVLMQRMMAERNAALPEDKRILYRIGVNLGDVLTLENVEKKRWGSHARLHARAN
jgi:class 3 adenylate cyclase